MAGNRKENKTEKERSGKDNKTEKERRAKQRKEWKGFGFEYRDSF